MTFSKIKSKIDGWGIKYSWFAKKMGVSSGLVSQWWSGESTMTTEQETKAGILFKDLGVPPK